MDRDSEAVRSLEYMSMQGSIFQWNICNISLWDVGIHGMQLRTPERERSAEEVGPSLLQTVSDMFFIPTYPHAGGGESRVVVCVGQHWGVFPDELSVFAPDGSTIWNYDRGVNGLSQPTQHRFLSFDLGLSFPQLLDQIRPAMDRCGDRIHLRVKYPLKFETIEWSTEIPVHVVQVKFKPRCLPWGEKFVDIPLVDAEPTPLRSHAPPFQLPFHAQPIPQGERLEPVPPPFHAQTLPQGEWLETISRPFHIQPIPQGERLEPVPSPPFHAQTIPQGEWLETISRPFHVQPIPQGEMLEPVPPPFHAQTIPQGEWLEPVPPPFHTQPIPQGEWLETIPPPFHAQTIPHGERLEPIPPPFHAQTIPQGERLEPIPPPFHAQTIPQGERFEPIRLEAHVQEGTAADQPIMLEGRLHEGRWEVRLWLREPSTVLLDLIGLSVCGSIVSHEVLRQAVSRGSQWIFFSSTSPPHQLSMRFKLGIGRLTMRRRILDHPRYFTYGTI